MLKASIPQTGIPLPFISARLTSLLVFMHAMGIVIDADGLGVVRFNKIYNSKIFVLCLYFIMFFR